MSFEPIPHLILDCTEQISVFLKGSIEISGPKFNFHEFLWRVSCVTSYDLMTGLRVSRNTLYIVATLIFDNIRYFSNIHTPESANNPIMELISPVLFKGFTDFPVEKRHFPMINRSKQCLFRYKTTGGSILRIRTDLNLRACKFKDCNRDIARARGYVVISPQDSEQMIEYFSLLENSVESAGRYDRTDMINFITHGIEAFVEKPIEIQMGFMEKIKKKIRLKSSSSKELTPASSASKFDALSLMEKASCTSRKYNISNRNKKESEKNDKVVSISSSNSSFASARPSHESLILGRHPSSIMSMFRPAR